MISNCSKDENGRYSGGAAGDQNGKEYCVRSWYNRPWNYVLRYPKAEVGERLAKIAKAAARNENIGYNQSKRLTYYNQLKIVEWKPSNITVKCDADCSSSTAANVIATGYRMNIDKMKRVNPSLTTHTLRTALTAAGFVALTDSKYTKSEDYLLPGDILLYEGHHVAINLDQGKNINRR